MLVLLAADGGVADVAVVVGVAADTVVVVAAASTSVTEVWLQCIRVAPGIIGEMRGAR